MAPTALRQAEAVQSRAPTPEGALEALSDARNRTFTLVAHLDDEQLAETHSSIMSPLAWDLAHIAAYEDLWISHRHAGMELLRADLAERYDAFETPRSIRGEIELLDPSQAREYMTDVRTRAAKALKGVGTGDGTICEMVVRHELQHSETMRQTMALAGLLPPGEPCLPTVDGEDEWIDVPAGTFEMGAGRDDFAYDNERPRHTVELGPFQIARRPVTNASRPGASGDPDAPVCHISWHEADELARAQGARLPSEAEWEKAAKLGVLDGVGVVWEWTSSFFGPYPGFEAHPYKEYSEVFFGEGYRVLRGGSWATSPRVKTLTFRNWDLPIRRQIFAGLRLARDAA